MRKNIIAKSLSAVLWFGISSASNALADGYPFDHHTQQVHVDSIRFKLSENQIEQISSTGRITFSEKQLRIIRLFYPKAKPIQSVVSATFNDGLEGRTSEEVDIFWISAEEIAITLNHSVISNETLKNEALTSDPEPTHADIRLSPKGDIYIQGKKSSLRDAMDLIMEETRTKEKGKRLIIICLPPPYHSVVFLYQKIGKDKYELVSTLEQKVSDTFTSLKKLGESHEVEINQCW